MPSNIDPGDSVAAAASGERGNARNPVPAALTNVAAARPAVSAMTAIASGIATATMTTGEGTPWKSDWSRSHSLMKPLSGGRAMIATAPIMKNTPVAGMRRMSPPRRSRSRSPVARTTDPAARNNRPLNAA